MVVGYGFGIWKQGRCDSERGRGIVVGGFSRIIKPPLVFPHGLQPAALKQHPGFVDRIRRALT